MSASCDAPAPSLTRRRADLQIESVRGRGVIALVARRVDVALSPGVDAARQAALVELGLDLIGIERGQAERDVTDRRPARRRRRAGPRAPVAAAATPDDDVADIADLALVLTALIGPRLPPPQKIGESGGGGGRGGGPRGRPGPGGAGSGAGGGAGVGGAGGGGG